MLQNKNYEDYEECYKCQEKKTKYVSVAWKVFHVTVFILLAFAGFLGAICLYYLQETFDGRCVLYTEPSHKEMDFVFNNLLPNFTHIPQKDNETIVENGNNNSTNTNSNVTDVGRNINFRELDRSHWRLYHIVFPVFTNRNYCSIIFFIILVSIVSATILGTFFMVCSKGGRGYDTDILHHPQHLMYPIIIFCIVLVIMTSTARSYFVNGIDTFCRSFSEYFKNCLTTLDDIAFRMKYHRYSLSLIYQLTDIALLASAGLWATQLVIAILRIVFIVDYEVYKIRPKHQEVDGDDDHDDNEEEDLTQSVTLPSYSSTLLADGIKAVEAETKL